MNQQLGYVPSKLNKFSHSEYSTMAHFTQTLNSETLGRQTLNPQSLSPTTPSPNTLFKTAPLTSDLRASPAKSHNASADRPPWARYGISSNHLGRYYIL